MGRKKGLGLGNEGWIGCVRGVVLEVRRGDDGELGRERKCAVGSKWGERKGGMKGLTKALLWRLSGDISWRKSLDEF